MTTGGRRDELIAALYRAAPEDDALAVMAGIVMSLLGTDNAGLWIAREGEVVDLALTAEIAESGAVYLAHYRHLDPWTNLEPAELGRVTLASERYDERELVRTEFYNDFARHYGMLRPMGASFAVGEGALATIALNRASPRHLFDGGDKAGLQALLVHLQGALALRSRFLSEQATSRARHATLDAVAFAVVVSDAGGRVVFANRAAEAASRGSGPLLLGRRGTGLAAALPRETAALREAVSAVAAGGEARGLRLGTRDGAALAVLATPLFSPEQTFGGAGRVMLSFAPAERRGAPSASLLRQLYGLSPAQTELCAALLAGSTFEAAAEARGVAVSTMRSHFNAVLDRTGTGNLRDLLRTLSSLPPVETA